MIEYIRERYPDTIIMDGYDDCICGIVHRFGHESIVAYDQEKACKLIFDSDSQWTVVRGSNLEEGESQGLPVWSQHVGDSILESNITRRVDFALFMVEALENDELIHKSPAIVGCQTPSAIEHASN